MRQMRTLPAASGNPPHHWRAPPHAPATLPAAGHLLLRHVPPAVGEVVGLPCACVAANP
jgi:hypothetical protein